MNRLDHDVDHAWHVALNESHVDLETGKSRKEFRHWMYEAKRLADEIPRMMMLFARERLGTLPKLHRQCSHSGVQQVPDNHLTCCLGVECRKCEHLLDLDLAEMAPEQIDQAKAWTCGTHIVGETQKRHVDTSEGYLLTVDDHMFWSTVYHYMAMEDDPGKEQEDV